VKKGTTLPINSPRNEASRVIPTQRRGRRGCFGEYPVKSLSPKEPGGTRRGTSRAPEKKRKERAFSNGMTREGGRNLHLREQRRTLIRKKRLRKRELPSFREEKGEVASSLSAGAGEDRKKDPAQRLPKRLSNNKKRRILVPFLERNSPGEEEGFVVIERLEHGKEKDSSAKKKKRE